MQMSSHECGNMQCVDAKHEHKIQITRLQEARHTFYDAERYVVTSSRDPISVKFLRLSSAMVTNLDIFYVDNICNVIDKH